MPCGEGIPLDLLGAMAYFRNVTWCALYSLDRDLQQLAKIAMHPLELFFSKIIFLLIGLVDMKNQVRGILFKNSLMRFHILN